MLDLPPVSFADLKVESVDPRYKWWEYRGFQIYLTYAADRRKEVFDREMTKQQSLVEHLAHDLGARIPSLKVLEGLIEPTIPWRRSVGLRKARGAADAIRHDPADKIAVMCCHRAVMEEIKGEFMDRFSVTIYHNSKDRAKVRALRRFNEDPQTKALLFHRDIVLNEPGLLDLAGIQDMLIVEADWRPEVNAAAVMRMHKRGQAKRQRVRFVGLKDSIDARLQQLMKQHTRRIVTGFYDDPADEPEQKSTSDFVDPFSE